MTRKAMDDHPQWDYWMHENVGDGRLLEIDHFYPIPDDDIRNRKYDVNQKRWCRRHFWSADEAALISFARDPDKIPEGLISLDEDDPALQEHTTLCKHMSALHDLIVCAQKEQRLEADFFAPDKYIEWANRIGISIPPHVAQELEVVRVERERISKALADGTMEIVAPLLAGNAKASFDRAQVTTSEATFEARDEANTEPHGEFLKEKTSSQQIRKENNFRKVIRALLILRGAKTNTKTLSVALEKILEKEASQNVYKRFRLSSSKIEKLLDEALALYEENS
jgi:hypothetical protein